MLLPMFSSFFCAIPPSLRPGWALRMAEIIKPGGYLITLCFPMDGDRANGPPYSLSPELYETTLGDRKWKVIANFVPKESEESHKGRERLIIRERVET